MLPKRSPSHGFLYVRRQEVIGVGNAERCRRAAQNAPGPFYAEDWGCDCGCLLPEAEATDLLATAGPPTHQTYFRRQPGTPAEVERACAALLICPVHSLRYGGRDPAVLARLADAPHLCDYRLAADGSVLPAEERHAAPGTSSGSSGV